MIYIAKFSKNDGGWHSGDYHYYLYMIYDATDSTARMIAEEYEKEYIAHHDGYFSLIEIHNILHIKDYILDIFKNIKKNPSDVKKLIKIYVSLKEDVDFGNYGSRYNPVDVEKNKILKKAKIIIIE